MRNGSRLALAAVIVISACLAWGKTHSSHQTETQPPASEEGISVYFSPHGGCTRAIVEQIDRASRTIDFQAYSFTNTSIAHALADARQRGVKVRALLDRKATVESYTSANYLLSHDIPTYTDGAHPIAHNKIIVIDGKTVITGSFNFTQQAENSNAENLVIITGKPKLAAAYRENFELHLAHSEPYRHE
jgi:phosphatidylserine/phosphatidylglycerophosphate/cardiolipin synthase-like enzyme